VVPAKQPNQNLVVGTWNVRDFDKVTEKWRSVPGDSPIRDVSNVACIAEVVRRFDVAAIQEVRQSAQAFLLMMQALGKDWAFLVTDVTRGKAGSNERLPSCSTGPGFGPQVWRASWSWLPSRPGSQKTRRRASSLEPLTG
jgi:hypothetical protein